MVGSLLGAVVVAAAGQVYSVGSPNACDRPIATPAPCPAINGRLWVTQPIMNGVERCDSPASVYGAFGNEDAAVYAKSGHLIVPLSPWVRVRPEGLKQLRRAQDFWLAEQGYTGGVRTFVNDAYLFERGRGVAGAAEGAVVKPVRMKLRPGELPEPAFKIEVPAETPRVKHRVRI